MDGTRDAGGNDCTRQLVRFTYDAIEDCFQDGSAFETLIAQLVSGSVDPLRAWFCRLRALNMNGQVYSLNNQRLHCDTWLVGVAATQASGGARLPDELPEAAPSAAIRSEAKGFATISADTYYYQAIL